MAALRPLTPNQDLTSLGVAAIRDAIVSGTMRPGQVFAVGDISQQLGISRTPVREAVLLLQEQGYVDVLRNRGVRVSPVDREYVRWVLEYRSAVEGFAARMAATRITPESSIELRRAQAKQEAATDLPEAAWLSGTEALHALLIRLQNNELLSRALQQMEGHYTRVRRLAAPLASRRTQAVREHVAIVDAILNGDAVAAEEAMIRHLSSLMQDIFRSLPK